MDKKSSFLCKLADRLLKNSDRVSEFESAQKKAKRIKSLHEEISKKYKFNILKGYQVEDIKKDANFLKTVEKKLTLTNQEIDKLDRLFSKYKV